MCFMLMCLPWNQIAVAYESYFLEYSCSTNVILISSDEYFVNIKQIYNVTVMQ